MGKLNIAHHKSYHPYRADNIERVRRDEEEARLKEAIEDGRVSLADSEARISLLRERAKAESKPSKHKQQREEEKLLQGGNPLIAKGGALTLTSASGHINFFEELEHSHQNTLEHSGRAKTKAEIDKAKEKELERGVPLMPDEKDRRPWYMDKGLKHPKDMTDEEVQLKERTEPETEREKWGKRCGTSSKTNLDPLKDMKSHLAARSRALSTRTSNPMPPPAPPRTSNHPGPKTLSPSVPLERRLSEPVRKL
ncbi:N-terminal domain of CBF1 interacting co-repressor CIR [Rhizoctonia solani]|uniref:N-terminal domain of CBF1 interacting co-repressor CIR n=1 Tax=Rhizoctonia solani TaxID=456999 RepID=A0A8H7LZV1_9AGAM|nr:N-terminal domain of CBF1 interacting co-repressor CIR [Rhizoctonia solani]